VRQKEMADKDQKSSSKVEKELHDEEKQSMVEKVIKKELYQLCVFVCCTFFQHLPVSGSLDYF
jgi:hypothetical protein